MTDTPLVDLHWEYGPGLLVVIASVALLVVTVRSEPDKTPDRRSVSDEEFFIAIEPIQASWTDDEIALIQEVSADPRGSTDADLCAFGHYLYGRLDLLSHSQRAVLALYDISPPSR